MFGHAQQCVICLGHHPDVSVSDDRLLALLGLGTGSLGKPAQGQDEAQEHLGIK